MANGNDMKRIGGLWVTEKNGRKFLSGKLNERFVLEPGMKLFIFPARERKSDKSPTHYLMAAAGEQQADQDDQDLAFGVVGAEIKSHVWATDMVTALLEQHRCARCGRVRWRAPHGQWFYGNLASREWQRREPACPQEAPGP